MSIKASDLIAKFQYALEQHWGYIWGTAGILWTEARQRALEATTDEDRASGRQYGAKWIGHIVADCSGLFHKFFEELGGYMYHGSNTMWDRYCTSQGKLSNGQRTDGEQLLPGAAVFCYNSQKQRRSHVGLYVGDGHVIEASGTINGVIMTKISNRKWVEWGHLKGVLYDQEENTMPDIQTETRPTLRRGSKGEAVRWLQEALISLGYSCGAAGVDGDFGKGTQAALVSFQLDHCLAMDGICGPKTYAELDKAMAGSAADPTYTIQITGLTKDQVTSLLKAYPTADVTEERR